MTKIVLLALAFAMAASSHALAQNPPVSPSPVKRTVISKIEVPNSDYEVVTALLEIAPGFKAGRHKHPGIVNGYITEGQFWLAMEGQPEKILNVGDSAPIPEGVVHNEGAVGDKPLKAIVTYVVKKGEPMVQPVKD